MTAEPNKDKAVETDASGLPVWVRPVAALVFVGVMAALTIVLLPDAMIGVIAGLVLGAAAGLAIAVLRRGAAAPQEAPKPVVPETPAVRVSAAAIASDKMITELRQELERYKEIEKQLTQAKLEAESAMMAKGEFLATMSHEIRTPLNGIIPLLDILLSTKLAPDQRDYLVTAYQSAKQLLSIVDDILDYSKIEANKLDLEVVGLNIKEVVDSVSRLMGKAAEQKGVRFTTAIDPNVRLAMRGDPTRLRQVLTNLVSNAIKFTERGQIALQVTKRGETRSTTELLFSVRDTGAGISPEGQAKLFKAFSQADASTTRIHGGTGLGLVICKRIVDLMGGQIGLKSELGKGSTFWFTAPLTKAAGDVAPAKSADVQGSRALVVTTDQTLLRRTSALFSTWGVNMAQTGVSAEALAKLRSAANMGDTWAYDFLVVDWASMKNTALSLVRNVLREATLERVRIVAIATEEEVPPEFKGVSRVSVFSRQFGDVELRAGMQRLLEATEAGAAPPATPVEQMLPALPDLPPAPAMPPPTAAPAPAPVAASPPAPAAGGTTTGHVLLVEDNAVNRQVAQRLLSLVGATFDVAEHGKQALERLETGRYDAVLMDCMMPIMDGYTAARSIRKLEAEGKRQGRIPVVAMTANAMAGDREKCLAAGMDDYMSKPLNRQLLEQMLRKWLPSGGGGAAAAVEGAPARPAAPAASAAPNAAPRATVTPLPTPAAAAPRAAAAFGTAPKTEGAAVNQEIIQDLLEMMGSEFTDLVRVYLEDTPKSLALLERAAAEGDAEALAAPSHSLKSTSANLGALQLSEMAKRIEHGARSGTLAGEPVVLVAQLVAEYQRVQSELKRLLASAPT